MKISLLDLATYLKENNVGLFFVPEPIKSLPSADGLTLYKVNEIHMDEFLKKLTDHIGGVADGDVVE